MFCPKCGYPDVNTDECPKCGVYISRYLLALEREKAWRAPGEAAALWDKAYRLHYTQGDRGGALALYRKIIDDYRETPEAGYAAQQITIIGQSADDAEPGVTIYGTNELAVDPALCRLIPGRVALRYLVVPIRRAGPVLTVAMADTSNTFVLDEIKFMTGYDVKPVAAHEDHIRAALDKYYGSTHHAQDSPVTTAREERLISCPDCGREVSKRAAACPNCGCPIKEVTTSGQELRRLADDAGVRVNQCPACGSAQIEVKSSDRKTGTSTQLRVVNSARPKTYICADCRHEW